MDLSHLDEEQRAEAERLADVVMAKARVEVGLICGLLASKGNGELFGETEFRVRGMLHRLGAAAFETALEERKKGGIAGRRSAVRNATGRPASSRTATRP